MMMMMMLIMMVMIISQMELWRRGGRVDFRQKGRTPAEAQGSVDDNEYDEYDEYDDDDDDDDGNLSSRLHLFSRGLQAGLVQCQ